MQASSVLVKNLGLVNYQDAYTAMQSFTKERLPTTPDELWILQHPPVFTLGLAGNAANLHQPVKHIPLIKVDRGGEITYHGPGQIIIYLLLDLKRKKLFVKELVRAIEQSVIDTLTKYGVLAERKPGAPGIYIAKQNQTSPFEGAKIAALGLKITKQCSYHGLALNVAMDMRPFDAIHPCGYEGLQTIDMKTLGISENIDLVATCLVDHLKRQLHLYPYDE
jgi:lipoyl(octanoyl) transferase